MSQHNLKAAAMTQMAEVARLRQRITQLQEVLEDARHSLTTLDGLYATDGFGAYGQALDDGCDPSGAWDCFVKRTWQINESAVLIRIDEVLPLDGRS